ncbi:hypothetical protein [Candidatus Poriferisodalis sp.]|uniref:hypothetical protein n=1 Tax=Candidatus Poriferisodalis sp. TaxID=3101277 RepID=UPI003B5B66E6
MTDPVEQPWVPFPKQELRRDMAEREAAGVSLWTEALDATARNKLAACVRDQLWDDRDGRDAERLLSAITQEVSDAAGVVSRVAEVPELFGRQSVDDFVDSIRDPDVSPAVILGLIEGFWRWQAVRDEEFIKRGPRSRELLRDRITEILDDHRIGFVFVDGDFLPRSGSIADQEILVPTVKFLTGDRAFADADSTYREALRAIQHGQPDEAITKACTALQSVLAALGCGEGSDKLSKQIAASIDNGLLAKHDKPLEGWLTADRGNLGSAHPGEGNAVREDAWLTVHVVGAIILRLARGRARGTLDEHEN